jgi:hypothetical protein
MTVDDHPVLLLCSSNRKRPYPALAFQLYRSEFFRLGWQYGQAYNPRASYLLSARYGLLPAGREVPPYPETMSSLLPEDLPAWAEMVAADLAQRHDLAQTRVVVLALRRFFAPLLPYLPRHEVPLADMSFPEAMGFLRKWAEEMPPQP